jgi:hypothetical protein
VTEGQTSVTTHRAPEAPAGSFADLWWVFVVNGVLWLFASGIGLRYTDMSITTVGVIVGVVLLGCWAAQQLVVTKGQRLRFSVGLFALQRATGPIVFAFSVHNPRGEFVPS